MFIREVWGKFTSFIFCNFEISLVSLGRFKISKKLTRNFPLKHVITSTNLYHQLKLQVTLIKILELNC